MSATAESLRTCKDQNEGFEDEDAEGEAGGSLKALDWPDLAARTDLSTTPHRGARVEEKNSGGSGPPSKAIIRAPRNTGAWIYVNLKDIPDSNERVCSGRYLHGRTAVQLNCPRPQALPRALRFCEMSAIWPFVAQVTHLLLFGIVWDAFVHRRRPPPQGPPHLRVHPTTGTILETTTAKAARRC